MSRYIALKIGNVALRGQAPVDLGDPDLHGRKRPLRSGLNPQRPVFIDPAEKGVDTQDLHPSTVLFIACGCDTWLAGTFTWSSSARAIVSASNVEES